MPPKTKSLADAPLPPPLPLTDAEMKERSGQTWDQWFKQLDTLGGPELGRRNLCQAVSCDALKDAWLLVTLVVEYERARGVTDKDGRPKGYGICATKTIAAPAARVYQMWASAKNWNAWFTHDATLDFSEGGRYQTGDGDAGEIKKLRENKAIKFTWENPKVAPDSMVEAIFQSKGDDKCVVMVNHDRIQTRKEADDLRDGWSKALDTLKAKLETTK